MYQTVKKESKDKEWKGQPSQQQPKMNEAKKGSKKEEYKKRKERFAKQKKSDQPWWAVTGFIYQARPQARKRGKAQEHMKDDE